MYTGAIGANLAHDGMGYMLFDPTYILILIGLIICCIASSVVKSTFKKYSKVSTVMGLTGEEVARRVLQYAGINNVAIIHIPGNLTDHFDPRTNQVFLSDDVYGKRTVSAMAVAAHECGHAIQYNRGYAPLSIRSALVPVANFSSSASWFLIFAGFFFSIKFLLTLGIIFFCFAVVFQLVTLPVEYNASARALTIINDAGLAVDKIEKDGAKQVLSSAALTYVASAASSILQLLRLILLSRGRD